MARTAPLEITDQICSCCEAERLWARTVGGVDVVACPSCDRIRCVRCDMPVGRLLEDPPVLCEHCGGCARKRPGEA